MTDSVGVGVAKRRGRAVQHGLSKTKEYSAWKAMNYRCHNPRHQAFKDYGARGIHVCSQWRHSVENFIRDLGKAPSPNHELDRIDNDGNYEPGQVRWTLRATSNRNSRRTIFVTLDGERSCLADAAKALGRVPEVINARVWNGWPPAIALAAPKGMTLEAACTAALPLLARIKPDAESDANLAARRAARPVKGRGVSAVARQHGLPPSALLSRLRQGKPLEQALRAPVIRRDGTSTKARAIAAGIPPHVVYARIKSGMSPDDAIAAGAGERHSKRAVSA